MVSLYKTHSNQILDKFLKSSYFKCGLKCFRFLSIINILKIEKIHFLKILQKKWNMNIIIFYWSQVQVQLINAYENKNYDHNNVTEDFGDQN